MERDGASNGNGDDSQKTGYHQCDFFYNCFSFDGFADAVGFESIVASDHCVASMASMVTMASMASGSEGDDGVGLSGSEGSDGWGVSFEME